MKSSIQFIMEHYNSVSVLFLISKFRQTEPSVCVELVNKLGRKGPFESTSISLFSDNIYFREMSAFCFLKFLPCALMSKAFKSVP